jgi:hypothetical protein
MIQMCGDWFVAPLLSPVHRNGLSVEKLAWSCLRWLVASLSLCQPGFSPMSICVGGIFGGQSDTGMEFSPSTSVFPCQYHSNIDVHLLIHLSLMLYSLSNCQCCQIIQKNLPFREILLSKYLSYNGSMRQSQEVN